MNAPGWHISPRDKFHRFLDDIDAPLRLTGNPEEVMESWRVGFPCRREGWLWTGGNGLQSDRAGPVRIIDYGWNWVGK